MEEDQNSQAVQMDPPKLEFKKPILVGKVGKLPKKASDDAEKPVLKDQEHKTSKNGKTFEKPKLKPPAPPTAQDSNSVAFPSIPYKEPKWSGLCPDGSDYALEVLKSGMIMETIDLVQKPYFVFGRLANCDVVMAHPTVSRYHAVLQYKAFAEESEPASGWYMFDLGSTHGTFLNKEKVKPHHYTRVRVGHQIKFGTSTRTYILTGPDFDCEGESDLTVTEIKAKALIMRNERDRMIAEAKELREKEREEAERRKEEQGIDWGMGEDAEEEPDLAENPYAITSNEELYLEDPKKTLRGFYEREGHELSYDCEERGQGQFICRVELPIDDARGRPVKAEVIHKGKKKEAVVACALEACRILDRAGLLRQAKHESRRRKERDWSADDYYDSDEDSFLDRTGSVERKRDARMKKHGVEARQNTVDEPLTYDSLQQKVKEIESKIAIEEKSLKRLRELGRAPCNSETGDDGDSLDTYMQSLVKQGPSMAQKADISNTKMTIKKLQAELSKTQRLAEIARPAHLPPLLKKDQSKLSVKIASNSVVYGKRIRLKDDQAMKPKPKQSQTQNESEFVEEMDSDEDDQKLETNTQMQETQRDSEARNNIKAVKPLSNQETRETDIKHTELRQNSNKNSEKDEYSSKIGQTKSEAGQNKSKTGQTKSETDPTKSETDPTKSETDPTKSETDPTKSEAAKDLLETHKKKQYGPMRPPDNYVIPESYYNQTSDRDLPEIMDDD